MRSERETGVSGTTRASPPLATCPLTSVNSSKPFCAPVVAAKADVQSMINRIPYPVYMGSQCSISPSYPHAFHSSEVAPVTTIDSLSLRAVYTPNGYLVRVSLPSSL